LRCLTAKILGIFSTIDAPQFGLMCRHRKLALPPSTATPQRPHACGKQVWVDTLIAAASDGLRLDGSVAITIGWWILESPVLS
jgi:hypothetical protein